MIDLHGHYLPGVDDGAESVEQSLAMLRHAERDGIAAVAATPHACGTLCRLKDLDTLRSARDGWRRTLAGTDLELTVVDGAEVYFTSDLLSVLRDHRDLLTLNDGSYFLLEFPSDFVYAHSRDFIYKVLGDGFIPVISHAERNQEIQRSVAVLRDLVKAGALCQVNAGSFRGDFGNAARRCAFELVAHNLVHVIASDAHNLDQRRPELSFVTALLQNVPAEKIEMYLNGIPRAIVADEAVPDIGDPLDGGSQRSFFDFLKKRGK